MHANQAMLTPPKTNMTSWKITYFSIRDTSDSFMVAFAIMFVFGGIINILQPAEKKKQSCKHDSDHDQDKKFLLHLPNQRLFCLPQKRHTCCPFVGKPNLHISGFVSMKREQPATTPPKGQGTGKNTVSSWGSKSFLFRLSEDYLYMIYIIYIYLYMVAPTQKNMCFVQN